MVLGALAIVLLDLRGDGLIRERRETECVATLAGGVVESLGVVGNALVPHEDGAGFVANAALEVLSLGDVVEEEAEEVVGFLLVEAN